MKGDSRDCSGLIVMLLCAIVLMMAEKSCSDSDKDLRDRIDHIDWKAVYHEY